jgi:O-antigen ligase
MSTFRSVSMPFWILCVFFFLCAVGGGSSKVPTLSLLYLRPAAVLCLGAIAMLGSARDSRRYRTPLLILAALAATIAIQLVPLPLQWVAGMPGHAMIGTAARLTGESGAWHPISLTPDLTLNSLLALLPSLVVLWAFASMREEDRARSALVLPLLALATMVFGIVQLAQGPSSPAYLYDATSETLPVGLFGNRNHQGTLLAIAIPAFACIATILTLQRGRALVFFGLAGALSVLCVLFTLLTGSRSGLALVGVGALGALAIAWPAIPRGRYRTLVIAGTGVALIVAIGLAITLGRANSVQRLTADSGLTAEMRVRTFPVMMQMIRDYTPWGSGFGGFDPVFRHIEPDALLRQTFFNNAHNDFIELAITGGIPALVVLVVAIVWYVRRGWDAVRPRGAVSTDVLLARLGWLSLLMIALASLSDYPVRTPLFAAIVALAAAWICPPIDRRRAGSGD